MAACTAATGDTVLLLQSTASATFPCPLDVGFALPDAFTIVDALVLPLPPFPLGPDADDVAAVAVEPIRKS